MTAKIVVTGWQIGMMLPARGRWQQFRLKAADTYTCAGCETSKTTQLVAIADRDWSAPTCTECYQVAVAAEEGPEQPTSPAVTAHEPPARIDLQRPKPALQQYAAIVIARAAGQELSPGQTRTIAELEASDAYPALVRFAYALVDFNAFDGVAFSSTDRWTVLKSLDRELRSTIDKRRAVQSRERAALGEIKRFQDPLPALVLHRMLPDKFTAALGRVMKEKKLSKPTPRDLPNETLWEWLAVMGDPARKQTPAETQRLRGRDHARFKEHLGALVREADPSLAALSHPALLERWEANARSVVSSLGNERRRFAKTITDTASPEVRRALAEIDAAYAMACAMDTIATMLREDLEHRIYLKLRRSEDRTARASRLVEAANRVVQGDPRLGQSVSHICATHTATCPLVARGDSCVPCVPVIVARLEAMLAQPAPRASVPQQPKRVSSQPPRPTGKPAAEPAAPRLIGPGQSSNVRWLPTGDRIRVGTVKAAWQVAVTRDDMNRGRCPIPDGTILPSHEIRRLRLYVEHSGAEASPQTVTLRHVGGRWQLDGLRWPQPLNPGTLVDFTWRTDGTTVTAVTKPLRRPERVDGTEFRHEFDRQIVTRELAPGGHPEQGTRSMSAEKWVLRTLRILGHLCPEGTATLAEDALVRNCLDLGMPARMANDMHAAATALIKDGKIHRVRGGRDAYGDLWYPARLGDTLIDLLRYQPAVEVMKPQSLSKLATPAQRGAHQVHGFVRRLPAGAHASDKQLELYEEAVSAAEIANRNLDPDRYTFVAKFRRGATRGNR